VIATLAASLIISLPRVEKTGYAEDKRELVKIAFGVAVAAPAFAVKTSWHWGLA
jgi:hypothetical protein